MNNWDKIDFKNKKNGQIKTICPECHESRKNKRDKSLSANYELGVAMCHNCNTIIYKNSNKNYTRVDQNLKINYSDQFLQYFKKERGISEKTLRECKVSEELKYQPAVDAERNSITFNYYENGVIVNKKFRDAEKNFTQISNAKKTFYGIDDIIDQEEVIIVEGEIDKLSYWECGIRNVISVPNGANDISDLFIDYSDLFSRVKTFLIAVDNDEKGRNLENELARRLGKYRCKKVVFPDGCKDANDVIVNLDTIQLQICTNSAEFYPVIGVQTISQMRESIYNIYYNGMDTGKGIPDPLFDDFNTIYRNVDSKLTIWTGYPGSGKSTFMETYLLHYLINYPSKMAIYSPEHYPLEYHYAILHKRITGKDLNSDNCSKDEVDDLIDWANDKIFMINPDGKEVIDWDYLLEKSKELVYRYGINFLVIDAFNKVFMKEDSTSEINKILNKLTYFKMMYNVHIHLVAHTRKPSYNGDELPIPNPYDIAGSAHSYNQADNVIIVHRDLDNITHVKTGKIKSNLYGMDRTEITFMFDKKTSRYFTNETPLFKGNILTGEI